MKTKTFKRGIHPPESKDTEHAAIKTISPAVGQLMVFPMQQHIGAPCKPVVKVGDRVLLGQVIGDNPEAFVCAPIHSSVSGTVKEIRPSLTPSGITCPAVVIENDGQNEECPTLGHMHDYESLPRVELLRIIRNAGIVGLGGAGFPTHVKLNPPADKKIDTFIINASECEPYLTTDHRVLLEEAERLRGGVLVVLKLFPEARAVIGIETNKADAIKHLQTIFRDIERVTIQPLTPKYPQGAEKQLIYAITRREVPSGKLPADAGCVVNNVDTVIAIERAVLRGRPLIRKVVTVTGDVVRNPGNFKVRLGTSYRQLIEETGGFTEKPYKMISGGPMMGVAMFDIDIPVIKTSSAVLCFSEKASELPPEQVCIRCGRCVDHCPINLLPYELNQFVMDGRTDLFEQTHGMDCIECGSCSFVCPAKRHLAHSIRATRRQLMAKKRR